MRTDIMFKKLTNNVRDTRSNSAEETKNKNDKNIAESQIQIKTKNKSEKCKIM